MLDGKNIKKFRLIKQKCEIQGWKMMFGMGSRGIGKQSTDYTGYLVDFFIVNYNTNTSFYSTV